MRSSKRVLLAARSTYVSKLVGSARNSTSSRSSQRFSAHAPARALVADVPGAPIFRSHRGRPRLGSRGDLEDPGIVFRQDHFQYLPAVLDALLETGFARGEIDVRLDLDPA